VAAFQRAAADTAPPPATDTAAPSQASPSLKVEVSADRERLVLVAGKEIVLRCGAASITLLMDGTVLIKGTRLVSSATGLNRIRGAAVKIN
jgi:hypothetical protein